MIVRMILLAQVVGLVLYGGRLGADDRSESDRLIDEVLKANSGWLNADALSVDYTFSMEHPGRNDGWTMDVELRPERVVLTHEGKRTELPTTIRYDPGNNASAPPICSLRQGVAWFGPLQELSLLPGDHDVALVGEEQRDGNPLRVLKLTPKAEPSPAALALWNDRIYRTAKVPKYWYEVKPVLRAGEGEQPAIELVPLFGEGPSWEALREKLQKNAAELTWKDVTYRAIAVESDRAVKPLLVVTTVPKRWRGRVPDGVKRGFEEHDLVRSALIKEGEAEIQPALEAALREVLPPQARRMTMRIGCGIWSMYYGYSGSPADEAKLWIDAATGVVRREEGFREGKLVHEADCSDFEKLADGRLVPTHVVVTLLHTDVPWVFDMRFSTHDGNVWLLESLTLDDRATAQIEKVVVH